MTRNLDRENNIDLTDCPYCHRPLNETQSSNHVGRSSSPNATANFASPEYFRMLHRSLPGSEESSGPPSPRRRLTNRVQSGRATPALSPGNAEFIGSSPAAPTSPHRISSAAFSPNYFKRFFVEERELGRGGKGVVLLVKHVLDGVSLGHFALKRIPVGDDHEWLEKVLVEVQLLQHLSHQNLVSYRHVWLEDIQLSPFGPSVPCAFVLQQYCNAGDLHKYICSSAQSTTTTEQLKERLRRRSKNQPEPPQDLHGPRKLHFDDIYSFFKDITSGLNHLHTNGYIHRDLKPSNCLLHDTGKELRVLVSDFGEVQRENMVRRSTGATGTISYCAPEVLRREHSSGAYGNFTTKSDIFSLGMILYFLCFAELPYHHADNLNEENEDLDKLREEIATWSGLEDQKSLRPDLPDRLYRSLRRLLSLNPLERPSAEDILHGIKSGTGLEGKLDSRPRPGNHLFDETRTSSRISSVDTPPRGSPLPQTPNLEVPTNLDRPRPPPKLQLESLHKHLSDEEDESSPAISINGSLVLHTPRVSPSPTKISIHKELPQLPLPPPPRQSHLTTTPYFSLRIVFLILKIASINLSCMPVAARPTLAYPLLGIAMLDMLLLDYSVWLSVLLLAMHAVTLVLSSNAGVLCVSREWLWDKI